MPSNPGDRWEGRKQLRLKHGAGTSQFLRLVSHGRALTEWVTALAGRSATIGQLNYSRSKGSPDNIFRTQRNDLRRFETADPHHDLTRKRYRSDQYGLSNRPSNSQTRLSQGGMAKRIRPDNLSDGARLRPIAFIELPLSAHGRTGGYSAVAPRYRTSIQYHARKHRLLLGDLSLTTLIPVRSRTEIDIPLESYNSSARLTRSSFAFASSSARLSTRTKRQFHNSRHSMRGVKTEPDRTPAAIGKAPLSRLASALTERARHFSGIRATTRTDDHNLGAIRQRSVNGSPSLTGLSSRTNRILAPLSTHEGGAKTLTHRPTFTLNPLSGRSAPAASSLRSKMSARSEARPILVDFSPTVVLNGDADPGEFERRIIHAIERHSHELARLVLRELQAQRRAAF